MKEIKNLKKAAKRIEKAARKKERIILFGDADLDGVGSVVMLKEAIQNLGGQIASVFFPDRENDGYGITERALSGLKELAPALLISVDLGIGNFKEAIIAKQMGFEIIVIDHHQILEGKLPKVSIIVDPKQKGDKYPFKNFATVGLVFKLSEVLLGKGFSEGLRNSFLEIVALATIADMMPQEEDNKEFIGLGLDALRNTFRPGLKAFFGILEEPGVNQKMISALNTCEVINDVNVTYAVLTAGNIEEAKRFAQILIDKNNQKQNRIKEILREVEARVNNKSEEIIFEGDSLWPLILAGSVASTIFQKYGKPTFIFKKMGTESVGSVRVPKGVNSVDAMQSCAGLLITYGGHPPASGFRIKNENLGKFKECLIKYFTK